jgi:DNA helicase-2/ATP-dependent DNA helicase PcrA
MKPSGGKDHLNPQQRRAVETADGHVLVLAGAGSGKTRVLTERIAYLIRERKVSPERILAFTFTNKAAGEMRSRVENLLGRRDIPLWVGTFHATGVRILRREAKHIGFQNNFAIYDEDDSSQLIKDCIKKEGWGLDENPIYPFKNRISRWKNALVPPDEAAQESSNPFEEKAAAIYASYTKNLKKCNAFDFDDLITRVVELFTAHPRIKERYSRQFLHVLVDEFQDTNTIQMVMIDALASRYGNLFVVGDEDQSIYGWRGATVENILQFDRVYEDTVLIKLEENYRSTNRILDAANHLIANNIGRRGKTLFSRRGDGEFVRVAFADDEMEEANLVREVIKGCIREGYKRSDMAVLYRTHAQSRALENSLLRGSLPYQIIGGVRFYERREIKDLLAYLKLINNPNDDVSFRRIVNVPRRGIGAVTLAGIERAAGEGSLLEVLMDGDSPGGITRTQRGKAADFAKMISRLRLKARKETVYDLLGEVMDTVKYREYLLEDRKTAETRIENAEELLVETQRFAASAEKPYLAEFLEEIALISDIDGLRSEETVALMTLHNSKGLEYDIVMITGLDEGLLPHYSSFEDQDELEEERRLFYVGMTRAKERLYLFSAANRLRFGSWVDNSPSRFLGEIPERFVEELAGARRGPATVDGRMLRDASEVRMDDVSIPSKQRFRVGMRVRHPSYGEGIIKKVEGSGKDMKVAVQFPGHGQKKFLAAYAPFAFGR